MRDLILSVDIGTSKVCALAWDATRRETLALRAQANDAELPRPSAPGGHEQDPSRILRLCLELIQALLDAPNVDAHRTAGIGFSGQMHGVLLVDASLEPLTPFHTWRDARLPADDPVFSLDFASSNGCRLHPGYGGATLAWLARNGALPKGATALTIADFVAARLAGVAATGPTHAASWGIFDVRAGCWHTAMTERLGIDAGVLPPVVKSARPAGEMSAAMAGRIGLPRDVAVCSPIGDNQASFIGVAGLDNATAVLNLGTGGQLSTPVGEYVFHEGLETRPMPFGGYILVGASLCGGWAYAYLCDFFRAVARELGGVEISQADAYARMNALAASAPGAAGLRCDTRFLGARGAPERRGAIHNIDTANLTPANLTRAVLEGMLGELFDMTPRGLLEGMHRIVASGNAVRRNPVMRSLIEQVFGRPCQLAQTDEEAAVGAAIATAAGLRLTDAPSRVCGEEADPRPDSATNERSTDR